MPEIEELEPDERDPEVTLEFDDGYDAGDELEGHGAGEQDHVFQIGQERLGRGWVAVQTGPAPVLGERDELLGALIT